VDWLKLLGFAVVLFMALEALSAQVDKLKSWLKRLVIFGAMAGACIGLGFSAPFVSGIRAQAWVNAAGYFAAEYFIFLFLRNELRVSLKDFILARFGGGPGQGVPPGAGNARG